MNPMNNSRRSLFSLLMFIFVVFGTAPLVIIFGMIGVLRFSRYWEFLVAGFLFELLYGTGGWSMPFPFPVFLGSAILFVILELLRTRLR